MQENNILDDLDINNDKEESTGTNAQLLRAIFVAIPIQFLLWVVFFKLMDYRDSISSLGEKVLLRINSIDYKLNLVIILVFFMLLTGAGCFAFLANAKNQTYRKIIPLGLFFSFCSVLDLSIWRGIQENEPWYQLLINFYGVSLMMMAFQFALLVSLVLLMKKKWLPIAILLMVGVFFAMGFVQ